MLVSVRFEEEEGRPGGRCALYVRKSMTCRLPLGYIDYESEEEKQALYKITVAGHPEVDMIDMEVKIGNFVDLYFKK